MIFNWDLCGFAIGTFFYCTQLGLLVALLLLGAILGWYVPSWALLVLSQVPCLPMHSSLHLYHISWCIDFGRFDICVLHSVLYHVCVDVHIYLCCICIILHFRMMRFFHMPHLSFFGYLWDFGHMCGEMVMWGYALEIFEIYVWWDSPFWNKC
jgi:hypothetical protein